MIGMVMNRLDFLLVLLGSLSSATLSAQSGGGCAPQDDFTQEFIEGYTLVATDTTYGDAREYLGIPLLQPGDVVFISDSAVCHQAAQAYSQAMGDTVSRLIHVLRLGSRYLVVDWTNRAGEWTIAWVFDLTFVPQKRITI